MYQFIPRVHFVRTMRMKSRVEERMKATMNIIEGCSDPCSRLLCSEMGDQASKGHARATRTLTSNENGRLLVRYMYM